MRKRQWKTRASAAHFTRCHLTQLSCSAEINSFATNPASFALFIYLDLCSTGSTLSLLNGFPTFQFLFLLGSNQETTVSEGDDSIPPV